MAVTSAIVLFAIIWFMVLFMVLPLNLTTQSEAKDVVPGTPGSAPMDPQLRRKAVIVTLVSIPLWAAAFSLIVGEWVTLSDFDLFERFGPGNSPVFPTE